MPLPSLGDLAQNFVQRSNVTRLSRELSTLGEELSTGLKSDVAAAMRGDTQALAGISRGLSSLDAHDLAAKEAAITVDATERKIDQSRSRFQGLFDLAAAAMNTADQSKLDIVAARARQDFDAMVSDLNAQAGGISLFSGTATDGPALRPAADIFADVTGAVAGLATAADVTAAVDAYFAPGGDFDANDYIGSPTARGATRIGPEDVVDFAPRADDAAFREGLAVLARYAVVDAGALDGQPGEKFKLITWSRDDILGADGALLGLQARAGAAQARVEAAQTRNAAERQGLETARNGFVTADPFETATRLQQTQVQLESLYTVTARLSRLNLTSYL